MNLEKVKAIAGVLMKRRVFVIPSSGVGVGAGVDGVGVVGADDAVVVDAV